MLNFSLYLNMRGYKIYVRLQDQQGWGDKSHSKVMSGLFEDKVNTQNPWCIIMAFPDELTFLHNGNGRSLLCNPNEPEFGGGIDTPNEGLPWVTLE